MSGFSEGFCNREDPKYFFRVFFAPQDLFRSKKVPDGKYYEYNPIQTLSAVKKEVPEKSLPEYGIKYIHFKDLGGRRKTKPDSVNLQRNLIVTELFCKNRA